MNRARALFLIDVLIAVFLVTAIAILITGGASGTVAGVRFSLRRWDRPFFMAAIAGFARWRMSRGEGFLGQPLEWYRRMWARTFQIDADVTPAQVQSHGRWHVAIAAAGLLATGALMLHTQLQHMDSVSDLGDPLFSMWRMGWVHRQFAGDARPFFDANIFHPTPLTLTLSDAMLLPSAAASPLLSAGIAPAVAYNVLLLSGSILSGLAAYLLIRRVTGSARAAFIGALLYAFYPYRWEHYSHLELQMTEWMPLALLCLHRFMQAFRVRDAVLAALCVVAQLYSSMYYGVFFVIYAAAVFGVIWAIARPSWRRVIGPVALAGVTAIVLAIPLARPYLAAQAMKGDRDTYVVSFYSANLSDYFRPHPRLAMYAGHLLEDSHPERALFPGVTPLVLAAVGLAPPLGPIRLAYSAGLAVAFDMSCGMNGLLYRYLYEYFPPIRGMRVPARFSVILAISLVVLGAFGARRLLARAQSPRTRSLVFAGLIVAVLIDLRPALDLTPVWAAPPTIYDALAGRQDVVLAEFPFELSLPLTTNELPFMYFSIWHGLPMVNGYSGFIPEEHHELVTVERGFPSAEAVQALRVRGVTHVTVNCALMGDDCPAFLARADRSPALRLVTSADWQGKPVRLYELVRN